MKETYNINSKVWIYSGKGAWYFATIPTNITEEINDIFALSKRAWGSLPVTVTIGKTSWNTSIFPDTKTKTFILPLKAEVRKKEKIEEDDMIKLTLEINS